MRVIDAVTCSNCGQPAYAYQPLSIERFWVYCPLCQYCNFEEEIFAYHNKIASKLTKDRLGTLYKTLRKYFGISISSYKSLYSLCDFFYWHRPTRKILFPFYLVPTLPFYGFYFRTQYFQVTRLVGFGHRCFGVGLGLTDYPLRNPQEDVYFFPFFDLPKVLIPAVRVNDPIAKQLTCIGVKTAHVLRGNSKLLKNITGKKIFFWPASQIYPREDSLLFYAWASYRLGGEMYLYSSLEKELKGSTREFINRCISRGSVLSSKDFINHLSSKLSRRVVPIALINHESLIGVKQVLLGDGTPLDFVDGCWFNGPTIMLNFDVKEMIIELNDDVEIWRVFVEYNGQVKEISILSCYPSAFLRKFKILFNKVFGAPAICKISAPQFIDFILSRCLNFTDVCPTE